MNWKVAGLFFCAVAGGLTAVFGSMAGLIWLKSIIGPGWATVSVIGAATVGVSLFVGWTERGR